MPYAKSFAVFDGDSHVLETSAIWDEFLDPAYRVPARSSFWYEHDPEFGTRVVLNGRAAPLLHPPHRPRHAAWRPGMTADYFGELDPRARIDLSPGATDVAIRLADMDLLGIDRALLFPTMFTEYFTLVDDPLLATALARAYNDWLLDQVKGCRDRLYPVAVLPLQDVKEAVQEARRAASAGFKAALVRPVFHAGRYPREEYFWPLWAEAEKLGLALCPHASPGPAAPEYDANAPFLEKVIGRVRLGHQVAEFAAHAQDNAAFLVAVMGDGLMERFPDLRMVWAHAGIAFVPLALEKAETYLWITPYQERPVSLEPEHVFKRTRNLVTFAAGDGTARRTAEELSAYACFGSRYPNHDTTTAWEAIDDLERGGVPDDVIARMMGGNAARVLDVGPALHVRDLIEAAPVARG